MKQGKILVIRNDRLGDFMLAYPSFALLKQSLPDTQIYALVPEYTRPMAEACPWIDGIVDDTGRDDGVRGVGVLSGQLRKEGFDAAIALYSTFRVGLALRIARVPYRLAPGTKVAQVLYNHRLRQRRSRSLKPEYEYNLDLIERFLVDRGTEPAARPRPPYLHFPEARIATLEEAFRSQHGIASGVKLVFIHPGSGGSADNLSVEQYARLGGALQSRGGHYTVILAGPGETAQAEGLSELLGGAPHGIHRSEEGLRRFAEHLQFADVFISGSTGTLHIAGALDRPTAAFYSRRVSSTALRWRTLNSEENRLAFSPPDSSAESDLGSIDLDAAARAISERFLV